MSAEVELVKLERQVLGVVRVRRFLDAVEAIRRLLGNEPAETRARVLRLVAPSIGRDLAAAISAAFDIGIRDAVVTADRTPKKLPKTPPPALVNAARAAERTIAQNLTTAKRLARAGADEDLVMSSVNAARNSLERNVAYLVNAGGNAGSTAAADALGLATVWVAETNACVTCLAYSGEVAKPGKTFPAGRSYGSRSTVTEPIPHPPAHPHCRCTVEPLNSPEYAAALRREADRSVLRGFSLESESMKVRLDAAERLLARDPSAPASVKAYARRAIKAGEFPTRGRP